MTAVWKETIPLLTDLLEAGWNRANTDNIKPVIQDISETSPEKVRTDLSDRTKHLHRFTFQIEVITFAELIP